MRVDQEAVFERRSGFHAGRPLRCGRMRRGQEADRADDHRQFLLVRDRVGAGVEVEAEAVHGFAAFLDRNPHRVPAVRLQILHHIRPGAGELAESLRGAEAGDHAERKLLQRIDFKFNLIRADDVQLRRKHRLPRDPAGRFWILFVDLHRKHQRAPAGTTRRIDFCDPQPVPAGTADPGPVGGAAHVEQVFGVDFFPAQICRFFADLRIHGQPGGGTDAAQQQCGGDSGDGHVKGSFVQ